MQESDFNQVVPAWTAGAKELWTSSPELVVSFEPDKLTITLDGKRLHLEPGQHVTPHGVDRGLDVDEIAPIN